MLNQRQTVFVFEYLKSGNAYQAAIKAGYTETYAKARSHEMLENVGIKNEILSFKQAMKQDTTVTIERLREELSKVAFANIGDYLTDDHQVKNLNEIGRGKAAAIASIKTTVTEGETWRRTTKEFKLHSKLDAIDKLMKHLGAYVTVNDIIERLSAEQLEELSQKLLAYIKQDPNEPERKAS